MSRIDEDTRHRLLTTRLPALPQVLLRVLALCRQEDSGLDDISELIGREPALSARLLSLATSAERHGRTPPRTLLQALIQLGLDAVRVAVIGESIQQVFNGLAADQEVNLGPFWRHSLKAAFLAKRLARAVSYPHVEEAYLAGLLHDVGQLAMLAAFPADYRPALAEHEDDAWLSRWEEDTFGFTHAEVGAWLAARWQLDGFLADALLYHHEVGERLAHTHMLVQIVWLAHLLAGDREVPAESPLACGPDCLQQVCDGIDEEVARVAAWLGIRLDDPDDTARAGAELTEAVRDIAMVGALYAAPPAEPSDSLARLRATALTARALFDLGDAMFYQSQTGRLRPLAPWPHLARGEELGIPVGEAGGCVGRAATSGRAEAVRAEDAAASLLDKQLMRLLGETMPAPALLAVPVGHTTPSSVLVFAATPANALDLQARQDVLHAFSDEAATRLLPAPDTPEPGLREQVRRAVHEASNPLGIIKNYLRILTDDLGAMSDSTAVVEDLAMMSSEIDRVSRILRGLGQPASQPEGDAGRHGCDINRAAQELLSFCREARFIPPEIRLDTTLQDALPRVMADRDGVKQILLNLLKNAVEALGQQGRITVSTSGHTRAPNGLRSCSWSATTAPACHPRFKRACSSR
ncbi:HDOD domain-containing protein [Parasulfuritortus cantonensis]|uniref:HDOD domain-containing protein n=1 Tax=Parasulfuritortus cantonensis TaxID=2528202 RepID=A0A4R1BCL0_9PROT|nr:HDOD domain-containing protein [Parasulfuritortus cantonensis]TCJ14763.1 HDOD domain-containing protein [Parasulfuritortus cantonensis]